MIGLIHTLYTWQSALIVDDKVEDNDSCTAVNINITSFIWKMNTVKKHRSAPATSADSAIF